MELKNVETFYVLSNGCVKNYENSLTNFKNDLPKHLKVDLERFQISCFGTGLSLELPFITNFNTKLFSIAFFRNDYFSLFARHKKPYHRILNFVKEKYRYTVRNEKQSVSSICEEFNIFLNLS